jgi:hypothetical protein
MSTRANPPAIHPGLEDVALIDGPTAAAAGGMSLSQFFGEMQKPGAPTPFIRRPRFTRYRLVDIREWLASLQKSADDEAAMAVVDQARQASRAAHTPEAMAKAAATRKARVLARTERGAVAVKADKTAQFGGDAPQPAPAAGTKTRARKAAQPA